MIRNLNHRFNEKVSDFRKSKTTYRSMDHLELRGVGLNYTSGDETNRLAKEKVVFEDLNFKFSLDDNFLLDGPMGSGRSSLMKVLAGLLVPENGSYFINDEDILQMSFEEFLPYRLHIGYSFDYGGLLANRTLKDNLLIPLLYHRLAKPNEAEKRVTKLLETFKIMGHENQRPASVSGAMRKATVVARSFVLNPEMLVLDDPFVGLDDEQGKNIVELIFEHRKSFGLRHVFYSTRYERFVKMLGGKSIVLNGSKISHSGDPEAKRMA